MLWDFSSVDALVSEFLGKTFPAAQMEIRVGGNTAHARSYGWLDPEAKTRPVQATTRFDLASVSKLFTVTAFMTLVEERQVALDQPVREVLPEFDGTRPIEPYPDPLKPGEWIHVTPEGGTADAGAVTFRHLLAHNSGLPAWLPLYQLETPEQMRERALRSSFTYPTGTHVVYSDIGLILVGMAVEAITGEPLDRIVYKRVATPLGLASVRYGSLPCEDIAPTEFYLRLGRRMCGEVHDENAWGLGSVAGHAGLFATAHDVAELGECYRRGGVPVLARATVAEMIRLQAEEGIARRGIGFALWSPDPEASSNVLSRETFGHTGFTGTSLWVDPARELVVACLTNRVYYGRDNADAINTFRARLHRAIVDSMRR